MTVHRPAQTHGPTTRWSSTPPRSGWARRRPRLSCVASRENAQHPTYKALLELGKAVKTVFLARYLHDRALRVEINDGLNVVEQWNSANDFIFFARRGEVSSNRREDQELSMLSLHLLQNCMVYVNTLMVQKVLARPAWQGRLSARDLHALTPLFWTHANPYGRFELDMRIRISALA